MPEESNSSSRKAGVESGFVRVEFDAPTKFVGDIRHEYVKNFNCTLALTISQRVEVAIDNSKVLQNENACSHVRPH
jgi:hypothetical protein